MLASSLVTALATVGPAEPADSASTEPATEDREQEDAELDPWFGFAVGTVWAPIPSRSHAPTDDKIRAYRMQPCLAPADAAGCSPIRGFDVRAIGFAVAADQRRPDFVGWFRTGYTAGRTAMTRDGAPGQTGDATSLDYFAIPLHFGGSALFIDKSPVRPMAGFGLGLDVVRARYERLGASTVSQTSAQIGIDLHAGVEMRLTNRFVVMLEAMQRWNLRRKTVDLPNFSNTDFTLITSVAVAFPTGTNAGRPR